MQFRIQGQRIQCIRSTYDPKIKRSRQKLIASFDKYADKIPISQLSDLTVDEHEELAVWWKEREETKRANTNLYLVSHSHDYIRRLTTAISTEVGAEALNERLSAKVWLEIGELQKALRKAGFPRPRTIAKTRAIAEGQGELLS